LCHHNYNNATNKEDSIKFSIVSALFATTS
jgi:hypothetical protein